MKFSIFQKEEKNLKEIISFIVSYEKNKIYNENLINIITRELGATTIFKELLYTVTFSKIFLKFTLLYWEKNIQDHK